MCKAWEASARRVRQGTRLVLLRTGIVLDGEEGGSLGMCLLNPVLYSTEFSTGWIKT